MGANYNGLAFRTSLEAQWAAFFDLAGWPWAVSPTPVGDWAPDFRVGIPCSHSECSGSHILLVAILPIADLEAFKGHPCLSHPYGDGTNGFADAGAAFGSSPDVTKWEMSHGAGSGIFDVPFWEQNASALWEKARTLVQ
ncbi:hypothetical protein [Devosia sp. A449]